MSLIRLGLAVKQADDATRQQASAPYLLCSVRQADAGPQAAVITQK